MTAAAWTPAPPAHPSAVTTFTLPPDRAATGPPESRGLHRDDVRLLVAPGGAPVRHTRFRHLADALAPGDLVVVNTSPTMPAAVDGVRVADDRIVTVHFSQPLAGGRWAIELRARTDTESAGRVTDGRVGDRVRLPGGVVAELEAGYPDPAVRAGSRLWRARIPVEGGVPAWLGRVGRPVTYGHLDRPRPLADYQTVLARPPTGGVPGSAEMASAGRPFSARVLSALRRRGVDLARLELHTGVSSPDAGEVPLPERFRVPAATADAVEAARARGGRIVAVGTTVTRALESALDPAGRVTTRAGWTDLVLGPDHPARVVTGLVTGWHEPQASHLLLLEAVAGPELVGRAYAAATAGDYLWHEFGDSCLLLP